jgi:hypothetical protein
VPQVRNEPQPSDSPQQLYIDTGETSIENDIFGALSAADMSIISLGDFDPVNFEGVEFDESQLLEDN